MYSVEFSPQALDDITRLDKPIAARVLKKIQWLAENFQAIIPLPLKGKYRGVYKLSSETGVCSIPPRLIKSLSPSTLWDIGARSTRPEKSITDCLLLQFLQDNMTSCLSPSVSTRNFPSSSVRRHSVPPNSDDTINFNDLTKPLPFTVHRSPFTT